MQHIKTSFILCYLTRTPVHCNTHTHIYTHMNLFIYLYQVTMKVVSRQSVLVLDSISCWSYSGGALKLRMCLANYTLSQSSWTQYEK